MTALCPLIMVSLGPAACSRPFPSPGKTHYTLRAFANPHSREETGFLDSLNRQPEGREEAFHRPSSGLPRHGRMCRAPGACLGR